QAGPALRPALCGFAGLYSPRRRGIAPRAAGGSERMTADGRRGLGRGLSALLGEGLSAAPAPARGQRQLPIGHPEPSPLQPRRHFDAEELEALAESIRANGI